MHTDLSVLQGQPNVVTIDNQNLQPGCTSLDLSVDTIYFSLIRTVTCIYYSVKKHTNTKSENEARAIKNEFNFHRYFNCFGHINLLYILFSSKHFPYLSLPLCTSRDITRIPLEYIYTWWGSVPLIHRNVIAKVLRSVRKNEIKSTQNVEKVLQ